MLPPPEITPQMLPPDDWAHVERKKDKTISLGDEHRCVEEGQDDCPWRWAHVNRVRRTRRLSLKMARGIGWWRSCRGYLRSNWCYQRCHLWDDVAKGKPIFAAHGGKLSFFGPQEPHALMFFFFTSTQSCASWPIVLYTTPKDRGCETSIHTAWRECVHELPWCRLSLAGCDAPSPWENATSVNVLCARFDLQNLSLGDFVSGHTHMLRGSPSDLATDNPLLFAMNNCIM